VAHRAFHGDRNSPSLHRGIRDLPHDAPGARTGRRRDAYRGVPGQTGTPQTAALDPRAEDGNLPEGELLSAGK
jgi:hypothetical protein